MADPLARAIEQLYRVPPSAFTRERNARATALALNDTGLGPATLLALRFPGAIVLAAAFAMASPTPILSGVTPSVLGGSRSLRSC